ncbi:glycerol-3-phosphate 1-O-acyltransferase PlsY [Anaplasma marginale]|uniref:glycerol-3-phosphate 1-O-acyltransferase PlsY n=1 Tax=Anaplasma marginale TaxID=770 RepID=UPI0018E93937
MNLLMGYTYLIPILFASYLIGSIPFSWILVKVFYKRDLRSVGSGNIGATNAFRVNRSISFLVLFLDIFKSVLVILILEKMCAHKSIMYLTGFTVVLGHIFPVWFLFKGGKGIAPTIGVVLSINIKIFFLFIITWAVVFMIFRYSSLSSIISIISSCIYCAVTENFNSSIFYIAMSIIVLIKHRDNVIRMINGTEKKLF